MVYSVILARQKLPNLYLSHIYFGSQFIFLSFFYRSLFIKKLQKRLVDVVLLMVFGSLCIQYGFNPNLFNKFNLFEIVVCSFPLVVYAIIHLFNALTIKGGFMYLNIGVILYLTSSTLIFILGDYLAGVRVKSLMVRSVWFVNKMLYVVYLLLIYIEWHKSFKGAKNNITYMEN